VRLALGATRPRLVRQLLTEHAVLAVVAGSVGLLGAYVASRVLSAIRLPLSIPMGLDLPLDVRVLTFGCALIVSTALLFGLAPALDGTRFDLLVLMKDTDGTESPRPSRMRSLLVAAQVAVSILLLTICGLFFRNLQHAQRIDLGFDPDGVVMTSVDLGLQNYSLARVRAFQRRLADRLRALPELDAVGFASYVPFELRLMTTSLAPAGYSPQADGGWPSMAYAAAGPGYFAAMRIPMIEGREFDDTDDEAATRVVILNDVAARQFWPDGHAVGRQVVSRSGRSFEVVGIARRGKYLTLGEQPQPFAYFPLVQVDGRDITIVARGGETRQLLQEIGATVRGLDAEVPLYNVKTLSEHLGIALAPARTGAATLTIVGMVAVLLTALGLYGTVGYAVSRRTYEIGIRRALGAQDGDVARLVVREAARLVTLGLTAGAVLAFVAARLLNSVLYDVNSLDPAAFGSAPIVLLAVAILAAWIPTRRAIRVNAASALRCN